MPLELKESRLEAERIDKFLREVRRRSAKKWSKTAFLPKCRREQNRYSVHLKIQKQQRNLDQIYDLLACSGH